MKVAHAVAFERGQTIIFGKLERVTIAPRNQVDRAQDGAVSEREVRAMQRVEGRRRIADRKDVGNEAVAKPAGANRG